MEQRSEETTDANEPASVSGRAVVTGFLAVGVAVIATASGLRYFNRERISEAQAKAMPTLATDIQVECLVAGRPPERLSRRGTCPADATLQLTNHQPARGTQTVLFALASDSGVQVGLLPPETPVTVPADTAAPGPRTLAVILSAAPLDIAGLQEAAAAIPPGTDLYGRLVRVESYVTRLRQSGTEARAERFDFARSAAGAQ